MDNRWSSGTELEIKDFKTHFSEHKIISLLESSTCHLVGKDVLVSLMEFKCCFVGEPHWWRSEENVKTSDCYMERVLTV